MCTLITGQDDRPAAVILGNSEYRCCALGADWCLVFGVWCLFVLKSCAGGGFSLYALFLVEDSHRRCKSGALRLSPTLSLAPRALQERDLCLEAQGPQLAALFARQLGRHPAHFDLTTFLGKLGPGKALGKQ